MCVYVYLGRVQLPRRLSHRRTARKRLRPAEALGKEALHPVELGSCASNSQLPFLLSWALPVMRLSWNLFSWKSPPHPYSWKPLQCNSLVRQVDFGASHALVCHGFPVWGERRGVFGLPRKVLSHSSYLPTPVSQIQKLPQSYARGLSPKGDSRFCQLNSILTITVIKELFPFSTCHRNGLHLPHTPTVLRFSPTSSQPR